MIRTKQSILTIVFIAASTTLRCGFGSQIDYHVKNSDFEVRCWGHTGNLVMNVICYKNSWENFPNINLDQTRAGKITFVNCSFTETLILTDTLHSFNITDYGAIQFIEARSSLHRGNLQNLKVSRLELIKSNSSKLPFDMLYNISSLRELLIERNNIVRIPEEFFRGWPKYIQKIYLNRNKLQKVAKNDFASLRSVKTIDLSNNKIIEIESGAFDDLISLKVLNLNNNQLRTLPSGIFHYLSKLKIIYLNKNPFDDLPHDLLSGIKDTNLRRFFMNDISGSLRNLPRGFFKSLTILNVIALENSNLEILPVDVFEGTFELTALMLGNNILKSLPYGLFNDTKKLLDLDLNNNRLKILPTRLFENLNFLEYLDVSYNHLESLQSEVLTGLYLLKELNVSHNNLSQIDEHLFASLKSAIAIDLSFNRITFDDSQSTHFSSTRNTSIFTKSSNKISREISDYRANRALTEDLKNIDLRHNNFTELTAKYLLKLNYGGLVDLRNNRISKINLTGLPFQLYLGSEFNTTFKTMKLLLSNNPLNCNCYFINAVHYLNVESSTQKFIKFIVNKQSGGTLACASHFELEEYYGVNEIHPNVNCLLKYNEPKNICPDTCICKKYPDKRVLSVDCSYKRLKKLPVIRNPHGWTIELNMSHNFLAQTPSLNESYLVNVTSLDLSYNNISNVVLGVFSTSLKDLKLHNNRISRLDSNIIEYLTNAYTVRSITLHDNKWSCDCQALQFLSFIKEKLTKYKLHKITCYGTKRKLYKMTIHKMCKSADVVISNSSLIMIIVFGIIVGSLATILLYYNNRKRIKVWLYTKRWCLQVYTMKNQNKDKQCDAFVSFLHRDLQREHK